MSGHTAHVHPFDDRAHLLGDLLHLDRRLEARGDSLEAAGHAQVVVPGVLDADGILRVDARRVRVALLDRLLHLAQLLLVLLLALLGHAVDLLGGELDVEELVLHGRHGLACALARSAGEIRAKS